MIRIQVNELLAGTDGWHQAYQQELKIILQRLRLGRALIQAADASLNQWVNAHSQVATALQDRRPVSVESLKAATVQIHDFIRKVREL